jgi:hypothetical protein
LKTALTVAAAIVMPGGFIILAIGFAAYLWTHRRKMHSSAPTSGAR